MKTTIRQSTPQRSSAGRGPVPFARRIALTAAVLTISASMVLAGAPYAVAATNDTEAEPDELQLRIEQSAAAYDEATANVESLEKKIEDNEAKISEIEKQMPEYEARAQDALVSMYKMQSQSPNLVSVILQSDSLNDFITTLTYVNTVHDENLTELENLANKQAELESAQTELEQSKKQAEEEQDRASAALAEAQAAREQAQREAAERAAREAAEAQKEQEEKQEKSSDSKKDDSSASEKDEGSSSSSSSSEPVETPSSDGADWSSDEEAFVNQWAPRINAYLAGSPLAGQGETFARAAWEYGVDPRWSPAISCTESSKGRHCFKPHNAWGWGSSSWGSWEEAIYAHVRGLARGYGYTISVSAAKKYCPPNWQHWYNATLAEMNKI